MADTLDNIEEAIKYIESPEYLRMIAQAQGEFPDSLLSGSSTQAWESVDPQPEPEPVRPTGPFGIEWNATAQRCDCTGCMNARERAGGVSSPAVTRIREGERPLNLTTRSDFLSFGRALNERRAFRTRGNLRGVLRPERDTPGYLSVKSANFAALWRADLDKIDYVVYSYNTPIAYHVAGPSYREWVYPDVTYSRTTSRHQSKIRAALGTVSDNVRTLTEES